MLAKIEVKDALQALVAAIMFGEDAGIAADGSRGMLDVGALNMVSVTDEAKALLADAYAIVGKVVPEHHGCISEYYVDSAVSDHLWETQREA